ncbi:MAG: hypothetical protein K6U88_13850 [Dehalococcoidia bacterium]|nr:hypothetical protein [Dehalococcoidia bacterium]
MPLVEFATDLVFGGLYGALLWVIALAAAIPYAAWQGIRRLRRAIGGTDHGDTRTGR